MSFYSILFNEILQLSYSTAYDQERCDITALAVQGGVVWLGTRNGYVLLLDAAVMEVGGDPLLGLQYCAEGKVRCIIPLSPHKGITKSLQVRNKYPSHIHQLTFIYLMPKISSLIQ